MAEAIKPNPHDMNPTPNEVPKLRKTPTWRLDPNLTPVVVCLCGSSKWPELHHRVMMEETLAGNIVIPMGLYGHADYPAGAKAATNDGDEATEVKQMLDALHHKKIDAAHQILVVRVDGYIGNSTRREIEYAEKTGKLIRYSDHTRAPLPASVPTEEKFRKEIATECAILAMTTPASVPSGGAAEQDAFKQWNDAKFRTLLAADADTWYYSDAHKRMAWDAGVEYGRRNTPAPAPMGETPETECDDCEVLKKELAEAKEHADYYCKLQDRTSLLLDEAERERDELRKERDRMRELHDSIQSAIVLPDNVPISWAELAAKLTKTESERDKALADLSELRKERPHEHDQKAHGYLIEWRDGRHWVYPEGGGNFVWNGDPIFNAVHCAKLQSDLSALREKLSEIVQAWARVEPKILERECRCHPDQTGTVCNRCYAVQEMRNSITAYTGKETTSR